MRDLLPLLAIVVPLAGCVATPLSVSGPPQLTQIWIADGFDAPEGAASAPIGGYFISNVAGGGTDKDGAGWITHLGTDGVVLTEKWADGLNAPKGMAVFGGELYVADIDHVSVISLDDPTQMRHVPIEGAGFLNDVTVWQGAVHVSDSRGDTIYRIDGDGAEVFLTSDAIDGVNGLLGDGDRMLVSTMGTEQLLSVDAEGTLTVIASGIPNGDGIGIVPGGYLVSSWPGAISFAADTGNVIVLLDTRDQDMLQNDLSVFDGVVIVPNWRPGTVTAYRLE